MLDSYDYLTYFLALVIGVSLGLTGGGGSIITVPVLVYVARMEPVVATAYSLFIVGTSSMAGALSYLKKGQVNFRIAISFALPAFLAVWLIRKFVIHSLPEVFFSIGTFSLNKNMFLMLLFAIIMLISGCKMICNVKAEDDEDSKIKYGLVLLSGILVGVLSGLVGAGGGFLIVPALVFFMHLPIYKAIGTSLLIVGMNSLVGFTGDVLNLKIVDWNFLLMFSLLSSTGVFIGIYLQRYFNGDGLKKAFGYFVFSMAILIIMNELFI